MRVLALDWGTVRIGVAISDPDGKIAFPLDQSIENKNAILEIKKVIEEKEVGKILIGLPKSLSGGTNKSTESVEQFLSKLQEHIICPIEYIDERLSTVGASKILTEQGVSQKEQRGLIDNLTAQQMLQQYLDVKNKINN